MSAVSAVIEFEDRRDQLLDKLSQSSDSISGLTDRIDAAARNFLSLGHFQDAGYSIIFSLDFCELIDLSGIMNPEISRKRILADIGFSRAAMRALRDLPKGSPLRFTILPGTVAEIRLYLNVALARAAGLTDAHELHDLDRLSKKPLDEILQSSEMSATELITFNRRLTIVDRLVQNVVELIEGNENFVSPADLALKKAFLDRGIYDEILHQLRSARSNVPVANNEADALNLAVAAALSSHNEAHRQVVVHMTRTPALHKLGRNVVLDMSVAHQSVSGKLLPVLCRPDSAWLFTQMMQYGLDDSMVEGVYLAWTNIASKLRLFETSRGREDQLQRFDRASRELNEMFREDPRSRTIFLTYLRLFVDSAARAEQLSTDLSLDLIDREDQKKEVTMQSVTSSALLLQDRIRHVFGLLDSFNNFSRQVLVASGAMASEREWTDLAPDAYPFLRRSGFVPSKRVEADVMTIIIQHPATAFVPDEPVVLLGCQLYGSGSEAGCTAYWPTSTKWRDFVKAVGQIEQKTKFFVMLGLEDDGLDYIEASGSELVEDPKILADRVGQRIIRIVQMCGDRYTYTCEVPLGGVPAHTSLTAVGSPNGTTASLYEKTGGPLPLSIVTQFVEETWRTFSDADDRSRTPQGPH